MIVVALLPEVVKIPSLPPSLFQGNTGALASTPSPPLSNQPRSTQNYRSYPPFFFFFEIRQNTLLLLLRDYFSRFNRPCRSRRDRSCWITSREKPIKHGSFFLSFSTPGSTHFFFFFFHSRDRLLNFFSLFACELFFHASFPITR